MTEAGSRRLTNSLKPFLVISLFIVFTILTGNTLVHGITPYANLTEWSLPTANSVPLGLSLDPSGRCCWFVESSGNKVGHLDPDTNSFQEWNIPTAGASPLGITTTTISGSLAIWGSEFAKDKVFVFYPGSGTFLEYSLPNANSGVEYTSVEPAGSLVRVWFTEVQRNANGQLMYDPSTGTGTLVEDTFPSVVGGGANGIFAGPGVVWYAGISSLVRWDRATNQYTIWPLPTHGTATGRFLTFDSLGQPWYTQGMLTAGGTDNYVGVLRGDNTIKEWQFPTAGSDPRVLSISPLTQHPWIAEQSSQSNDGQIATLDPSEGGIVATSTPTTAHAGGTSTTLAPSASPPATAFSTVAMPVTTPIPATVNGQFTEYPLGGSQPHDVIVDSSGTTWAIESAGNKIARITSLVLAAPDFTLSSTPTSISIYQGSSGTAAITVNSNNGFNSTVGLNFSWMGLAPSGISVSLPGPVTPTSGSVANSTLTVSANSSASMGSFTLVVTGTSGPLAHSANVGVLVTASQTSTSTTPAPSAPKCVIATATYGSEVSPEVQLLRSFRDKSIQRTAAGSRFMLVFNAWYYSFSPYIASYLATHAPARSIMKGLLYPIIGVLFVASGIFSITSSYPELAVLISGLFASVSIGALYLGIPLSLIRLRCRLHRKFLESRLVGVTLLGGIGMLSIGEALSLNILLILAGPTIVISALLLSGLTVSATVSGRLLRHDSSYRERRLDSLC